MDINDLLPTLTISDAQKVRQVLQDQADRIKTLESLVVYVLDEGKVDDAWLILARGNVDMDAHADRLKHIAYYKPYEDDCGKVSVCDHCGCINPNVLIDPETGRGRATLCCNDRDIGWGKATRIDPSDYKDYYTRTLKLRSAPDYPADIPTVMEGKRIPRTPSKNNQQEGETV